MPAVLSRRVGPLRMRNPPPSSSPRRGVRFGTARSSAPAAALVNLRITLAGAVQNLQRDVARWSARQVVVDHRARQRILNARRRARHRRRAPACAPLRAARTGTPARTRPWSFSWCSGVRLSRIQNERPCVESTRSLCAILMSVTGVTGRFNWNDCQCAPLSNEMYIPNSVPAYSSPARSGSSRTTRVGSSAAMPFLPSVSRVQRLAEVVGAIDVRREIAEQVAIDRRVGRSGAVRAGLDVLHAAARRKACGRHVRPRLAVVARHVDRAVVRPGPDHALLHGRLANRVQRAVDLLAGGVARDRLAARALRAFGMRGEIGTDLLPGHAAVARAVHDTASRSRRRADRAATPPSATRAGSDRSDRSRRCRRATARRSSSALRPSWSDSAG